MSQQIILKNVWRDYARDILELLEISDPVLLDDTVEFWRRVTSRLHMTIMDSEVTNARACIEIVGGTWDEEEYVADGELVIHEVYQELLSLLMALESRDFQDLLEGERQFGLPSDEGEGDLPQGTIKHETTQRNLGDLVNEVINKEINLNPEFQREYVWPRVRALRYIESLLLDIPTPSILLYEVGQGRLGVGNYNDVVDGRQRLETLLRFVATRDQLQKLGYEGDKRLKTPKEDHKDFKSFQSGGQLHEYANKFFGNLDPGMQRRFSYRKIPVTVITADDRRMLYHVFERYNLGSQKLNAAEIRNAVYQEEPIHKTVWELAREGQPVPDEDAREASVIGQLKDVMGKKKRYGTYNFIGRVMAFTHLIVEDDDAKPSANVATNRFFTEFDVLHGDHAKLRAEFVEAFLKVSEWYETDYAFVQPPRTNSRTSRGQFHEVAATVQMATAHYLRLQIDEGLLDEGKLIAYIQANWCEFAGIDPVDRLSYRVEEVGRQGQPPPGIFQTPQNAQNSWRIQQQWHRQIENASISDS